MPSAKVLHNGVVIAESDETIMVEGNHYFPPQAVDLSYFSENDRNTICPWKGVASYYDVVVEGEESSSAAWTYKDPSKAAERIRDYVAFYRHKVEVQG
ncbi:MAG: DUF427 domain-containing protein [Dehalococcoidia bacterium]